MSEVSRNAVPDGEPTAPGGTLPQYDENGIDLSLIRADMRLTPSERARLAALRVQQIGRDARRQSA